MSDLQQPTFFSTGGTPLRPTASDVNEDGQTHRGDPVDSDLLLPDALPSADTQWPADSTDLSAVFACFSDSGIPWFSESDCDAGRISPYYDNIQNEDGDGARDDDATCLTSLDFFSFLFRPNPEAVPAWKRNLLSHCKFISLQSDSTRVTCKTRLGSHRR